MKVLLPEDSPEQPPLAAQNGEEQPDQQEAEASQEQQNRQLPMNDSLPEKTLEAEQIAAEGIPSNLLKGLAIDMENGALDSNGTRPTSQQYEETQPNLEDQDAARGLAERGENVTTTTPDPVATAAEEHTAVATIDKEDEARR